MSRKQMSSREIRRMMERQERKEQSQQRINAFWALPEEERAAMLERSATAKRIQQNGITIKDLHDEHDKGYREGYRNGSDNAVMTCYAAVCLALKDLYGFGKTRCMAVLRALDEKVLYTLTGSEAVEEVFDKIGIKLSFGETFPEDRIQEGETA